MQNQNQKNLEQAKLAAQRIYKRINFDGGNLQSYELNTLMQETYDFLKIRKIFLLQFQNINPHQMISKSTQKSLTLMVMEL